jgi:hypothetical protein
VANPTADGRDSMHDAISRLEKKIAAGAEMVVGLGRLRICEPAR